MDPHYRRWQKLTNLKYWIKVTREEIAYYDARPRPLERHESAGRDMAMAGLERLVRMSRDGSYRGKR